MGCMVSVEMTMNHQWTLWLSCRDPEWRWDKVPKGQLSLVDFTNLWSHGTKIQLSYFHSVHQYVVKSSHIERLFG